MRYLFFVSLLLVVFLTHHFYFYKWLGYEGIPTTNDILDERDHAYTGLTFRQTGVATGWSTMDSYLRLEDKEKQPFLSYDGFSILANDEKPSLSNKDKFNYPITYIAHVDRGKGEETILLVQPFLEHPVTAGVLYSLGMKNNPTSFSEFQPGEYRRTALYLSALTGVLLFIASFVLYRNLFIGTAALVIYSITPTYLLTSRYALIENLLIPVSLLALILLGLYKNSLGKSSKLANVWLILIGIVGGLAILVKEAGVFVILFSLVICMLYEYQLKKINIKGLIFKSLYLIIPAGMVVSTFLVYAFYLAPDLYLALISDHAKRGFFGPMNFLFNVSQLHFPGFPLDGFWIWGFVSLIPLLYLKEKYQEVLIAFGAYLIIFLFWGGLNYSWYWLPFIPFMVLSSAIFLWQLLIKPNIFNLWIFFLLPFSSSFYWGYVVHHEGSQIILYRLFVIFFILLSLVVYLYNRGNNFLVSKKFLLTVVWALIFFVIFYQMQVWNKQSIVYIIGHWANLPELFQVSLK